jgi:uncharacterized protein YrrD
MNDQVFQQVDTQLSQKLAGKPIISVTNGQRIGAVEDLLIDPGELKVAAIITSKGNLLKREVKAIPAAEVQVWGMDAILVSHPDVVATEDKLPDLDKWQSVSEHIKGRHVVSVNGTRIGQLDDVQIDTTGRIVAYHLAQVVIQGPIAQSRQIPVEATRSLGKDVLIVDTTPSAPAPNPGP